MREKKQKSSSDIKRKRVKREQKSFVGTLLNRLTWVAICLTLCGILSGVGIYFYFSRDLPVITSLQDYRPPVITTVYSDDNRKIAEFYQERRIVISLADMPHMLVNAFISAEDARFYKHKGIDLLSILRAFFKNIEAGTIVQGGSTITQQVTKSFLLTSDRTYKRKIKEAILAYRIDRTFSKEDILFLYLNQIYLGHGAYGVEAAAENYFGKSCRELNLAECAILAGLPQAPSRYSPFKHSEKAKERQIYVLNRMVAEGFITNLEATEAINTPLDIKPRRNWYIEKVPYYTEYVRKYIEEKYGANMLYKDGLQVYTAVNIEMQKAARDEIRKGLNELDKREGYRGPFQRLTPEVIESFSCRLQQELEENGGLTEDRVLKGVVIDINTRENSAIVRIGNTQGILRLQHMKWARMPDPDVAYYEASLKRVDDALTPGDVIQVRLLKPIQNAVTAGGPSWELALEQVPKAEAGLVCIESGTGQVKVMIGGRDFRNSQFNRAIQSRRQPGSAFKPIIFAAAIDKGYTPATILIDSPIVMEDTVHNFTWKPQNYAEKFYGPTLFREALVKSRNVVTVKILKDIGIDYMIDYAKKLGISSPINRDLSIALGSSGVSLLELTSVYSVFNNMGYKIQPVFITKILDRDGNVLEEAVEEREKIIDSSTAYIITSLLESVVKSGTGHRVKALNRPAAGKTGTTNNLFDAWFMGYTPRYTTGTWVGYDEETSLGKGETGSRSASPIWLGFMKKILEDKPIRVFQVPEGVVFCKIDSKTGLLPIAESEKTIFECFKEGTAPTEYTKSPDAVTEPEDFFKSGI